MVGKEVNVDVLRYSKEGKLESLRLSSKSRKTTYNNISSIKEDKKSNSYIIRFNNGYEISLDKDDLEVRVSLLEKVDEKRVFDYLKKLSSLDGLKNDRDETIIYGRYKDIQYIDPETVLSNYLNPSKNKLKKYDKCEKLIFPFGCNSSQYKATKEAMENQLSVIQGPPGTGKTQTILNILANIVLQGKTALVVSHTNEAVQNIYDKMSEEKYQLDFLLAFLGRRENKEKFIEEQKGLYPQWMAKTQNDASYDIDEETKLLAEVFQIKEKIAELKQELSALAIEYTHFKEFLEKNPSQMLNLKRQSSRKVLELWVDFETIYQDNRRLNLFFKIKNFFKYGITDWSLYHHDFSEVLPQFQNHFYQKKEEELRNELDKLHTRLKKIKGEEKLKRLTADSMKLLRNHLSQTYGSKKIRQKFKMDDLWKKSEEFLQEYPIVLSTTFSSTRNLNNVIYDYLIIDEASQVDIMTGALAFSCAKNVIIVGDTQQLPNIVTTEMKKLSEKVLKKYRLPAAYSYQNSFLQSILDLFPDAPETLLREHYRCHPKIIQFCNQKFYNGELIVMTEDNDEEDVLRAIKTPVGNHARDHYSQREIDIIKEEIVKGYSLDFGQTAIIAPYRNQKNKLNEQLKELKSDTVHKFQGREKDTIIITTVDNQITRFTDDPHMLNVAISRAKKNIFLVTTGNKQSSTKNISDLLGYIKYHNFEVSESQIYSVFDYLYKQYDYARRQYLKNKKKISRYDSENLMLAVIEEVLSNNEVGRDLKVKTHYRLIEIIKETDKLSSEELKYVSHGNTHVDFLIFNDTTKENILAIEVDGYKYHKEGTEQAVRDKIKDAALEKVGFPLIRFKTNGSQEKEKLIKKLKEILSS